MPELVVLAEQLLAPVPGGTGRYTAELLTALTATAPAGWTVVPVTARHAAPLPGARALSLPRRGLTAAWELGLPLWPGGDSVHAPTPLAPPRVPRGRRLVVTVHDTVPYTHPETLTPRGVAWHRKAIERAVHRADAIVVPTEAVAAELRRYAPGPAQVHVIGHGVPEVLLREPSAPAVEAMAARLPDAYVLAVGTIEPRKGLDVLVAAMALPEAPDLPLVIAGQPGWGGVELPPGVHALGRVSDEELAVVLRRACVLAAPSRAEGFGLPVLEAMALGVPVVHSDAPALVEVAGGAGVSVPRGDARALAVALAEVAGGGHDVTSMARNALVRAGEFSWKRAAVSVWRLHVHPLR